MDLTGLAIFLLGVFCIVAVMLCPYVTLVGLV